jgi:hypothetical protein
MPSYLVRNIPLELWARVKTRAADEGRPLRWLIIRFLELYADRGYDGLGGMK